MDVLWQERLFGKQLTDCSGSKPDTETVEALTDVETVGVYFSFANINLQSDDFRNKLKELYRRLNTSDGSTKRLEIVQVVLWANNDVYSDFEGSHRDSLVDLPWFAMPFSEIDLKTRLSRRYQIKSGVPTLVLLDRDGAKISTSAHQRLLEDPMGSSFPWRPRPVDQILKDVALQTCGTYDQEHAGSSKEVLTYQSLQEGIRGFYFSANWCPPCRAFTPQLAEVYRLIRKREPGFEIIFISSDRSADSYSNYIEHMPWLAVPFQQSGIRTELAQFYGIRGIPTLLLLDRNGHLITMDARTELVEDPQAQNFPWKPRLVNTVTERLFMSKMHEYLTIILLVDPDEADIQFAESVLLPVAESYYKQRNIDFPNTEEECLQFYIGTDSDTDDLIRDLVNVDEVVPLLVGLDIPNRRYFLMDPHCELTTASVEEFIAKFESNDCKFIDFDVERFPID